MLGLIGFEKALAQILVRNSIAGVHDLCRVGTEHLQHAPGCAGLDGDGQSIRRLLR